MSPEPRVLAERVKDGICWQARVGPDRGRLEVVAVVPPSAEYTYVELLTETELLELLGESANEEQP